MNIHADFCKDAWRLSSIINLWVSRRYMFIFLWGIFQRRFGEYDLWMRLPSSQVWGSQTEVNWLSSSNLLSLPHDMSKHAPLPHLHSHNKLCPLRPRTKIKSPPFGLLSDGHFSHQWAQWQMQHVFRWVHTSSFIDPAKDFPGKIDSGMCEISVSPYWEL